MARQKRPTIQEVSRLSGVSVATVSRVLHGESGRFSSQTEQRVREAMAALNYAPDMLAQGMRPLLRGLPDGATDGGARLARGRDGLPVGGRQVVLVADDLHLALDQHEDLAQSVAFRQQHLAGPEPALFEPAAIVQNIGHCLRPLSAQSRPNYWIIASLESTET